ncbi:MAG: peptidoglycan DD-metalloendopeptidase family protein [Proteobacteria bacterium]|nr:peptidoglycan DD-metalloendopeptidase family protein [Pseudomonadota bacterium]
MALVLGACSTTRNRAPVEDRGTRPIGAVPPAEAASSPIDVSKLPNAEYAGKPGYYTVKPGDTLIRIGLDNGQSWRDLAHWNNLDNPNVIEVGQVLRVVAPNVDPNNAATRPITTARVDTKPLDAKTPDGKVTTAVPAPGTTPAPPPPPARETADDDITWGWPAAGPVIGSFEEGKVKGLVIGGKAGDPVLAAADGRVVYAGSGLRGYGNLVIIKHNNTYLTAYAHNQVLLVKDDQTVRRGQKIAEMGSTDADKVQLHFEIRKLGKPIDPARMLPAR